MDMPFDVLTTLMISATTVEIQVYDVVCTDAVIREHPGGAVKMERRGRKT